MRHPNSKSECVSDSNADRYRLTFRVAYGDSNRHSYSNANGNSDCHRCTFSDAHGYGDCDRGAYCDGDSYRNGCTFGDTDGHGDHRADAESFSDSERKSESECHTADPGDQPLHPDAGADGQQRRHWRVHRHGKRTEAGAAARDWAVVESLRSHRCVGRSGIELHGPQGFTTIINDNWRDNQEIGIAATGIAPTDNLESAILATLAPGGYTGIVRGKNNTVGVGLIEVYDLEAASASKLANLSTRAFVSTGSDVVIAGFLLSDGSGTNNIILRGIGPSLAPNFFPVGAVLTNPTLELHDSNGALLISDNDWQDNAAQAALISAAGLAPGNNLEAAIAGTLPPGLYTVILAGLNNGTGIGLVEVYDLGP